MLDFPEQLCARVGIHMGEITEISGSPESGQDDVVSLACDIAARVISLAQARQILLTRHPFDSVRQQVSSAPDGSPIEYRAHGPYLFKGVKMPLRFVDQSSKFPPGPRCR